MSHDKQATKYYGSKKEGKESSKEGSKKSKEGCKKDSKKDYKETSIVSKKKLTMKIVSFFVFISLQKKVYLW